MLLHVSWHTEICVLEKQCSLGRTGIQGAYPWWKMRSDNGGQGSNSREVSFELRCQRQIWVNQELWKVVTVGRRWPCQSQNSLNPCTAPAGTVACLNQGKATVVGLQEAGGERWVMRLVRPFKLDKWRPLRYANDFGFILKAMGNNRNVITKERPGS